jgi:hypothetical protein
VKRAVLPFVTVGLFAMVVADRLSHAFAEKPEEPAVVQGPLRPPVQHLLPEPRPSSGSPDWLLGSSSTGKRGRLTSIL